MRPKVSVITCSHNRPDMLRAAVESLRAQTDPDWEHLIYDDASTDPRVRDVLEWAKQDPRVRVWYGVANLDRPAVLWNFMLDRACGRYLTNLDDDNEKLPRFIEIMAGELDANPTLDLVTCSFVVMNAAGQRDYDHRLNLNTSLDVLNQNSTCDGGAMLYRRETFEKVGYFSEEMRTNEDWDWLRRAAHMSNIKNLDVCLTTYRNHSTNRMQRSAPLGSDADIVRLKSRVVSPTIGITTSSPNPVRLTRSQMDVVGSVERAIHAHPWIVAGKDLALVVSPFQMEDEEIRNNIGSCQRVLSLHMEDPYALSANLMRVRTMIGTGREVWVATNDKSCVPNYRQLVGDRIIVWPSLGADYATQVPDTERDIDVLFCGYAYPSRKRFVSELLPRLEGLRTLLVGDGWTGVPVEAVPTQDLATTYTLHSRAKTVICLHRSNGDCADGPSPPVTLNRGFMEGYCGPRVFMDRSRPHHALGANDVVWYDAPADLAEKLRAYLVAPEVAAANRFRERCQALFTYRERMAKILNCIRTNRFMSEIP